MADPKNKRIIISLAIVIVLILLWVSVRPDKPGTQGGPEKTDATPSVATSEKQYYEVRIPDIYDPISLWVPYVAEELGYFEEEGVKPVFTGIIPPGQHISAVVAGTNDVGGMHVNRTIMGIQGGAKIKAIVAGSETNKEHPHMEFVALEESSVKTPQDLLGKKIGILSQGGCHEYTPYEWLKKYTGVDDPRNKFDFVIVPGGNEETVLRTGEVDVVGYHGHPLDVFERGGVRVLFDDYDVWENVGGATPFYAREDFIEKNPEAVRRFTKAIARANNWVNEHEEDAKAIQAKRLGLEQNQVTVMYQAPDGVIKDDSIQLWIDVLTEYGELTTPIIAGQVYTNDFNDFAKELKTSSAVNSTESVDGKISSEKKYYEIRIPDYSTPTSTYVPYLAEELGFFEKEGIKPVFTGPLPPGQHIAAVVAGTNDVGSMHVNRTIVGIQGGAKIKAVVAASETTSEFPHMEYVVLEESNIREPKDLLGKKVGVYTLGGCNEFTPYAWIKQNTDIEDPRGVFNFVVVPQGNEEVALRTGEVDVVGFHGHPIDVFERGGVRVLFDDYMVWGTVGGATPYYATTDFIEKNPETIRRFARAMAQASNWLNANQEEAKKIIAKRGNVNPKQMTLMYQAPDGIIKEDSVQMWIDLLTEYGELTKPIKARDVYTNDFNDFAKDLKTSSEKEKAKPDKKYYEVRIPDGYAPTSVYVPYIAEELGYFEAEGVKPVFTGVIPAGQHVAAVVAGTNDVGTLHVNRTIVGIAGGAKIKAVVAQSETNKEFPHMEFVVMEDSNIRTAKDMIGKKVGVIAMGGCNEFTPYAWLKKNTDIKDPHNQFNFVVVPVGNEETALRTGEVDVMGFHGHPINVFERGGVRVLFDDYDVWGNVGGATPFYFREDFIEKNPEAVRRFVSAISKAGDWLNSHQEEAKVLLAKRAGINPNQMVLTYRAPNGIIKEDSVQIWIDLLTEYGELTKPIKASDVYTNEFNEFAKGKS
jgi:ABC-type nitrate/sulfonate/bicarbonate transport system substrate-binding protein